MALIEVQFDAGSTLYAVVQSQDGKFANLTSHVLEALSQVDWDLYDVACPPKVAGGQFYEGTLPSWLPPGVYLVTVFLQAGDAPSWSDDRAVRKGTLSWSGSDEVVPLDPAQLCGRSDIENVFGVSNVKTWADLENQGDADYIAGRISWAITVSTAWINDHLYGGPYTVPFVPPYPTQLTHMCARFSGVQLYESRGITDMGEDGEPVHQLSLHKKMVEQFVMDVLRGRLKFQGVTRVQDAPQVLTQPRFRPQHGVRWGHGLPGYFAWWDWRG